MDLITESRSSSWRTRSDAHRLAFLFFFEFPVFIVSESVVDVNSFRTESTIEFALFLISLRNPRFRRLSLLYQRITHMKTNPTVAIVYVTEILMFLLFSLGYINRMARRLVPFLAT